jgi:hypothetical protein
MNCLANQKLSESELVLSIFDFGGQSVFNVIHHLFLTSSGMYLLIFNMEDFTAADARRKQQCLDYLKFWLNSISIHTRKSVSSSGSGSSGAVMSLTVIVTAMLLLC